MKLVSIREVKNKLSSYLKEAKKEDIIVTKNGKPTVIIHHISNLDFEDYVLENDPKFRNKINKRWRDYLKADGISIDQLEKELNK